MTAQAGPRSDLCRIVIAGLLLCAALCVRAAGLPPPVAGALAAQGIPLEDVAIWVQAVDGGPPALSWNADRPMNPASVMKLVTAFAAFERLGTAHTWTTRILSDAPLRDGTLEGDLYVVGGGDPVLSYERVWKLLRRLRALGVERVGGDIVLDGSVLHLPPHDPHAFDGRGLRPYNAGAHGLLLGFNALTLTLVPAAAPGAPVSLAAEPPVAGLDIDNRLVTAAGDCTQWYGDLGAAVDEARGRPRLVLTGTLPASCGRRDWNLAPLPAERFSIGVVAALWAEVGGRVDGRLRTGLAPTAARLLIDDESPMLADVVRDMNKWSNNVIARQILATLSTTAVGDGDMVTAGAAVVRSQLEAAGIDTVGLVIENGAGLSRIERIRADILGRLLATVWQRPWMPEFLASLPRAGVDGTARKRLPDSPARGLAHIKTGTLDEVRSMAGYVLDARGRRHAVVMMVNHPKAAFCQGALDALLEWVWQNGRVME